MKTLSHGLILLILSTFAFSVFARDTISGIGITLGQDNGVFVVHEVFAGSPAERGGVHVNDIITAVESYDVKGKSLKQVVKLIRGPAGSLVDLTLSDGAGHLREAKMIREKFVISK